MNDSAKDKIQIAYIQSPSTDGAELYRMVNEQLSNFGYEVTLLNEHGNNLPQKQWLGMCSYLMYDIVIFDGSLENQNYSQYEYAISNMTTLDYVLIVSRTQLPYNFEGVRKGGAPGWIQMKNMSDKYEKFNIINNRKNSQILNWIIETIRHSNMELPRKKKLTEINDVNEELITELNLTLIEDSQLRMQEYNKNNVFVSFISRHSMYASEKNKNEMNLSVEKMIFENIIGKIIEKDMIIHYLPPGKTSNEIMTEERRWELVSMIEREMRRHDSILIYATEDYKYSWWTTAEKMALSYVYRCGTKKDFTLYVAEPKFLKNSESDLAIKILKSEQEITDFLPKINEEQSLRMARRFVQSDPYQASYEFTEQIKQMSNMTNIQKFIMAIMGSIGSHLLLGNDTFKKHFKNNREGFIETIKRGLKSLNSYTYTADFWEDIIFDCIECKKEYYTNFPANEYSVDEFINLSKPFTRRLSLKDSRAIRKLLLDNPDSTLKIKLPICGKREHEIKLHKNGNYFRFLQPRLGIIVNSKGKLIEEIDIIEQVDSNIHSSSNEIYYRCK